MGEKTSINYIIANEKIRNLVFEEWEKFNILISQGPDILKEYFCKLWNELKLELEYEDDIDIIDLNREIKPNDFNISYSILDNKNKALNFIMPKPLTDVEQTFFLTVVITKKIPRLFTLELSNNEKTNNCYYIGEWIMDFDNNDYLQKKYETIDKPIIGNFLEKINKIVNLE